MIVAQVVGSKLPVVAFCGTAAQGPGGITTFTFSGHPIGTEYTTRMIVVGIVTSAPNLISSVTVGGVAATLLARVGTAGNQPNELWTVVVPTGSTATVVVSLPAGGVNNRCAISTWAVYDLRSQTALSTDSSLVTTGTVNLTTRQRGIVIAHASNNANNGTFAWSETGEDYQINTTSGGVVSRSGFSAANGGASITITHGGSPITISSVIAASWR